MGRLCKKIWEAFSKYHHNRSEKETLKPHVHKLNKNFFEWSHLNSSVFYCIHFWTKANFLITVHLLFWNILILIFIVFPMQNVYFLKQYHQKSWSSMFGKKSFSIWNSCLFNSTCNCTATHTGGCLLRHKIIGSILPKRYVYHLVFCTG